MKKSIFAAIFGFALFLLAPGFSARPALAQTFGPKIYHYQSINTAIQINQDSTMDVTERQTYAFESGEFHTGERDISLQRTSAITDVQVVDDATGKPLVYSGRTLDGTLPASQGKFAYYTSNNELRIEWYFDLANATHTWTINYKVHGAIEFDKLYDRLYWNEFSGYSVPIDSAAMTVTLPTTVSVNDVQLTGYRSNGAGKIERSFLNGNAFSISGTGFAPNEAFTIDATWPKGIVSERAFFWDLISMHWLEILAALTTIICFLVGFFWWFFAIHRAERPGNIIPQYEPPDGLRPAVAEVVAKEKVTPQGLTATVVDLAVRGYLKIEEDVSSGAGGAIRKIAIAILSVAFGVVFLAIFSTVFIAFRESGGSAGNAFLVVVIAVVALLIVMKGIRRHKGPHDYRITATKDIQGDPDLKPYEKEYLQLLFSVGHQSGSVSTKDFKLLMGSAGAEFSRSLTKVYEHLEVEANAETGAFSVYHPSKSTKAKSLAAGFSILFWVYLAVVATSSISSWIVPATVIPLSIGLLIWFIRDATRRTAEGKVLRDEWLGFKLYLEVAEKYQLQNLTPDLFEKYLPYAMVFGIEKKWAKVFERASIVVPPPTWYVGAAYVPTGMASGGFSASAFSASFSSSFSSAFGGSAAGGGGGFGGGGAGGGGGGGGGGAR